MGALLFTITLTLIIDYVFEHYIIYSNSYSNTGKINRLINNNDQDEIPIFGSSLARNNYFPDSLDYNAFNYGMKGAIFEVVEPLMKIELEKEKDTPIIYNFHHLTFLTNPSTSIQLSNFVPFIENEHIKELLANNDYYKNYLKFPGLRYYGCYSDYLKEWLRPSLDKSETISKGGVHQTKAPESEIFNQYVEKRNIMIETRKQLMKKKIDSPSIFTDEDSLSLYRLESLLLFRPVQKEVDRFETLLEKNRHRKVILVYTPQHKSKIDGIENYDELIWFLKNYRREMKI